MSSVFRTNLKFGDKTVEVVHDPDCPICSAEYKGGKNIRHKIDKYLIENGYGKTEKYLKRERGIKMGYAAIRTHVKKHSPYIDEFKGAVHDLYGQVAEAIGVVEWDANEVLQEIINTGAEMVRNKELPITGNILMQAIKEQRERKQGGTIKDLIASLNKSRFARVDGEVVEVYKQVQERVPTIVEGEKASTS